MSYTAEDARRDSALGAQWMDEHAHGDWVGVIDTDKLDLNAAHLCVWGQTDALIVDTALIMDKRKPFCWQGGYFRVLDFLGLHPAANGDDGDWLVAHGFIAEERGCTYDEAVARYEMLTCAWIEQISLRRLDRAAAVEAAEAAVLTGDALTLSA